MERSAKVIQPFKSEIKICAEVSLMLSLGPSSKPSALLPRGRQSGRNWEPQCRHFVPVPPRGTPLPTPKLRLPSLPAFRQVTCLPGP